jgi:peroxiredoxin
MGRKDVFVLAAGLLAGIGIGSLVFLRIGTPFLSYDGSISGRSIETAPVIGSTAPDFELNDLTGSQVRLSERKGKVVLLNFWATWCLPCRSEMPVLNARYLKEKEHFEVLAINFDEPQEIVQNFINDLELSFPVLLDPGGRVQDLYRVRGYPTSYLIDQTGIVRIQHIGLLTESQLDKYLGKVGQGQ